MKSLEKENKKLKEQLAEKEDLIRQQEMLIEAYEHVKEFSEEELREADQRIHTQEIVRELMEKERMEADQTIKAHEMVEALSQKEKSDIEQQLDAFINISDLFREELQERDKGLVKILGTKNEDYLIFKCEDSGHGIRKTDLEHIFEQFYRTEDSPKSK